MNEFNSIIENSLEDSVARVGKLKSKKVKRAGFRSSLRPMISMGKSKSLRPQKAKNRTGISIRNFIS